MVWKVPPREDGNFFLRPLNNSIVKIVDQDIFQHCSKVKKCRIASNNVEYCGIMLSIVDFSKKVECC